MCYIDLEPCQVWVPTTIRKSRKPHRCDTCGRILPVGRPYVRLFWIFDGAKGTEKACLPCWRANMVFAAAHESGGCTPASFLDMLIECIDENDEGVGQWKRMLARIRKRMPAVA